MDKYIGVDISKNDFYACFAEATEPILFQNNLKGIKTFERYLTKNKFKKEETVIGVESTGIYHLPMSYNMARAGFTVSVINPLIVKKQNQISLRRVKNDKKDASLIRYCTGKKVGYKFIDDAETLTLKSLVRQRDSLANLKNILNRKQDAVSYKEKYLGISISKSNARLIKTVSIEIEKLEKKLKEFHKDEQKLLRTIPGVGPITAVSFVSEVGDINRFPSSGKLIAYVGLDSRVHQSGTSIHGKGYISKRGNKILRTRLYNACSVAVLHDNIFRDFFQKKRSEGKPYKVAMCATMNKMAHVIYAVWKNGEFFEDKRKSIPTIE
ncbi:MAG: IS110 family transposase [Candidatus Moranbacteria bacterium]|jgi:transposase|nr:IS110 family transposase [Candidatus Moranbacteria bacterium]